MHSPQRGYQRMMRTEPPAPELSGPALIGSVCIIIGILALAAMYAVLLIGRTP